MKTTLRLTTALGLLVGIAAVATAMTSNVAAAAACPYVLAQYCVAEKNGFKHTAWTNKCLAKVQGIKIIHKGAC
jgi:hypothetical protein